MARRSKIERDREVVDTRDGRRVEGCFAWKHMDIALLNGGRGLRFESKIGGR